MFRPQWVILRPSKKTDPRLHICFTETHCGIPNASRITKCVSVKHICNLGSIFFEGLRMTQ